MLFAQQAATGLDPTSRPTSSQTTDSARERLNQGRSNSSQFDAAQAELIARNTSNNDAHTFHKLRTDITRLGTQITDEQNRLNVSLDRNIRVSRETFDRIQRLMDQHNAKLAELEAFTTRN
jgi:hypothetical protein